MWGTAKGAMLALASDRVLDVELVGVSVLELGKMSDQGWAWELVGALAPV